MTCTRKITNSWRKRSTAEDGKISHAYGSVEKDSKNGYTTESNLHV
jgi:hypothetical protein